MQCTHPRWILIVTIARTYVFNMLSYTLDKINFKLSRSSCTSHWTEEAYFYLFFFFIRKCFFREYLKIYVLYQHERHTDTYIPFVERSHEPTGRLVETFLKSDRSFSNFYRASTILTSFPAYTPHQKISNTFLNSVKFQACK